MLGMLLAVCSYLLHERWHRVRVHPISSEVDLQVDSAGRQHRQDVEGVGQGQV